MLLNSVGVNFTTVFLESWGSEQHVLFLYFYGCFHVWKGAVRKVSFKQCNGRSSLGHEEGNSSPQEDHKFFRSLVVKV